MAILIDGYNLLHASGVLARGVGAGTLRQARDALLNFLASHLSLDDVGPVTVVFDATDAPPGLPHELNHRGVRVLFARDHESADAQLEELIRDDHAPRRLTVVSSDHRVQRAGKRRRARVVDSDRWISEVIRSGRAKPPSAESTKPTGPLSKEEIDYWLAEFTSSDQSPESSASRDGETLDAMDDADVRQNKPPGEVVADDSIFDPFPEDYFDDLDDDDLQL